MIHNCDEMIAKVNAYIEQNKIAKEKLVICCAIFTNGVYCGLSDTVMYLKINEPKFYSRFLAVISYLCEFAQMPKLNQASSMTEGLIDMKHGVFPESNSYARVTKLYLNIQHSKSTCEALCKLCLEWSYDMYDNLPDVMMFLKTYDDDLYRRLGTTINLLYELSEIFKEESL